MTEARFTLTLPALSHDAANDLASALEENFRLDPIAITINETDEAKGLWEVVALFRQRGGGRGRPGPRWLTDGVIAPMPQQDWVRQSLEGLAPVTAGRFFLHGSHDRERRRPGGISLEIDAGTAFGTGHHGTTEGCLMALDRILKRRTPANILDVGCGTGVLAIAAAKATGRPALASDIDPEAVRVTLANAALNGVKPLVGSFVAAGLSHPRIAAGGPYDLIFANILARPLVALVDRPRPGADARRRPDPVRPDAGADALDRGDLRVARPGAGRRASRAATGRPWSSPCRKSKSARAGGHPGACL